MKIDVDSIKDMISRETKPKKVYKYGIEKMIADGETVEISETGSNYEFYIAVGDGSPQRCTPNSKIRCKEHGTFYTNFLKLTGKACPNAILYVIDYNVHEVNFDITESRTITLNNYSLPVDVDYCAKGTVTFTFKNTFDNGVASILSYLNEGEYVVNDKLYNDIQDLIKDALKAFAKENGDSGVGFNNQQEAYQFYIDKKNDSDEKSSSLNKDIGNYQQSDYIINRSDINITVQAPKLEELITQQGQQTVTTQQQIQALNNQQAINMTKQQNNQALGLSQVNYELEIKKITAASGAVVRRIELGIQMLEDDYNLRKKDSEEALKYKYAELYSRLNQTSDREKMQFELVRMQLEKQFEDESKRIDVISGLLATMSQQNLLTEESIKNIIAFCQGILAKND